MQSNTDTKKVMYNGTEYNVIVKSNTEVLDKAMNDWNIKKMKMKMERWVEELEELPADARIEVPARLIDMLVKLSETDDAKHPVDCPCADCELANPLCQDCRKRQKYDDGICEKCYAVRLGCDDDEDVEEEEDSDDEEETPTCGFCGRDAGHSPIEHHKWDELYFCSEKCYKDYE
jgi:hypothetical protein